MTIQLFQFVIQGRQPKPHPAVVPVEFINIGKCRNEQHHQQGQEGKADVKIALLAVTAYLIVVVDDRQQLRHLDQPFLRIAVVGILEGHLQIAVSPIDLAVGIEHLRQPVE